MNFLRTTSWLLVCASLAACGGGVMPTDDGGADGSTETDGSSTTDATSGSDSATADSGFDPFAAPPGCSTGSMWRLGNRGSENMNPGQACVACHNISRGAPRFTIAGTVYQTAREPDNCNGGAPAGAGAVTVEITDSTGAVFMIPAQAASGNFMLESAITPPYRARVLYNGGARAMGTMQTSGDCNSCHGATGTMGAPGRIVLP